MARFSFFRPYVSVSERRRQAAQAAKKFAAKGRVLTPIAIEGRKIASTFWGKAWCDNLESYSDFANRLPRGRTYVRNGSVIDLQIQAGRVEALVQGSSLYKVRILIAPLEKARWTEFKSASTGKIVNQLDLLQGRLSSEMLARITGKGSGLFPSPKEIELKCSCPDWAVMCKHVASALYGIGARLDAEPSLFFTLRGVDFQELITEAGAEAAVPIGGEPGGLEGADLSEIFGVDVDLSAPPAEPLSGGKVNAEEKPAPREKTPARQKAAAKKKTTAKQKTTAPKRAAPKKKRAVRAPRELVDRLRERAQAAMKKRRAKAKRATSGKPLT